MINDNPFVIIPMPEDILAVKSITGKICINANRLIEIDEIFHDKNGRPSARRLRDYYRAVEKYYSGEN